MIGSFQAQYFKFLSVDPNTIFQFFVASDRLYLVRVGSVLNQIPQVMSLAAGPVGMSDLAARGLPSDAEVEKLVASGRGNYELSFSELTSCVLKEKHWFGRFGTLTMVSAKRGKLFYRFLDEGHRARARGSLSSALGGRLVLE